MQQNKSVKVKTNRTKSEQKQSGLNKLKQLNYEFHKTKIGSVRNVILDHIQNFDQYKEHSEKIEEKQIIKKFYKDLEQDHSYIQWIFPNFFNSMFNSDSYRLTIEERNLMIENNQIMEFYARNYKMFLKFLGIQLNNEKLELVNKDQFYLCLKINTHNQLRLKRVLASLSVLGKRNLAIQLLEFLQKEDNQLYGTQYYLYDSVKEEQQEQQEDFQTQKGNKNLQAQQLKQEEKKENISVDLLALKSKDTQDPQKKNEQKIVENSLQTEDSISKNTEGQEKDPNKKKIQQKERFNNVDKKQQDVQKAKQVEEKTKLTFNKTNPQTSKQFESQLRPNFNQGKYERAQFVLKFDEVKNYYVQGDLLDQTWVTINLFSKKRVDLQLQ